MTHRDRAGDPPGRREAAGDAGHRQGFPTPSGTRAEGGRNDAGRAAAEGGRRSDPDPRPDAGHDTSVPAEQTALQRLNCLDGGGVEVPAPGNISRRVTDTIAARVGRSHPLRRTLNRRSR